MNLGPEDFYLGPGKLYIDGKLVGTCSFFSIQLLPPNHYAKQVALESLERVCYN